VSCVTWLNTYMNKSDVILTPGPQHDLEISVFSDIVICNLYINSPMHGRYHAGVVGATGLIVETEDGDVQVFEAGVDVLSSHRVPMVA